MPSVRSPTDIPESASTSRDEAGVARERGPAERVEGAGLDRLDAGGEDAACGARRLRAGDGPLEDDDPAAGLREAERDRRALHARADDDDVHTRHGAREYARR